MNGTGCYDNPLEDLSKKICSKTEKDVINDLILFICTIQGEYA